MIPTAGGSSTIDALPSRPIRSGSVREVDRHERIRSARVQYSIGGHDREPGVDDFTAQFYVVLEAGVGIAVHFDPDARTWRRVAARPIDELDEREAVGDLKTWLADRLEDARGDDEAYGQSCSDLLDELRGGGFP